MFATRALPDGRVFNSADLVLPDGRVFQNLRLPELQAELVDRLGIGTHEDGKAALRAKYEAALAPIIEKVSRSGRTTPRTISQTVVRQAVNLLFESEPMRAAPPPVPHVSTRI